MNNNINIWAPGDGKVKDLTQRKVRDSSQVNPLNFVEKFKEKENYAIKAFNYVHNRCYKPLIDSPETVNFIIETMKDCNTTPRSPSRLGYIEKNSKHTTPKINKIDPSQKLA